MADELLAWVGAQPNIRIGETRTRGLGVFAARDLPANTVLLQFPVSCLLRAGTGGAADDAGARLQQMRDEVGPDLLDDRAMMILRLVHNRRMGRASAWRAYTRLLPGDEIVRALPMHWDDDVLEERLGGTALVEQVRGQKLQLRRLHERVVRDGLCARWPELFPPADFSWAALCWGHAIFWSRAICIPLRGGNEECLTPLLDLCNHAPGATHELRYVPAGGGSCALHAGRSVREGEELLINYGAKSNGELLRCHGFVLRDNQASAHGPPAPRRPGPSAPTRPISCRAPGGRARAWSVRDPRRCRRRAARARIASRGLGGRRCAPSAPSLPP